MSDAGQARPGLLPHQHDVEDINTRFPKMPTRDADDQHDFNDHDEQQRGAVEHMGDVIAEEIITKAREQGRRRKVSN